MKHVLFDEKLRETSKDDYRANAILDAGYKSIKTGKWHSDGLGELEAIHTREQAEG